MDEFKQKELNRQKMICEGCCFIYSPERGDPESNIEAYTNFSELPEEWICPICDGSKDKFVPYTQQFIEE